MTKTFSQELAELLNRHSVEDMSDTPDWILARFLRDCLINYNNTVTARDQWSGRRTPDGVRNDQYTTVVDSPFGGQAVVLRSNSIVPKDDIADDRYGYGDQHG